MLRYWFGKLIDALTVKAQALRKEVGTERTLQAKYNSVTFSDDHPKLRQAETLEMIIAVIQDVRADM